MVRRLHNGKSAVVALDDDQVRFKQYDALLSVTCYSFCCCCIQWCFHRNTTRISSRRRFFFCDLTGSAYCCIERSALSCPVILVGANPRARGARPGPATIRGATHIQVVSSVTRWRRLLAAVANSCFSGWGRNDRSTAAGRALRGTGYRQTGGIERSALSCPVILVRADRRARGARRASDVGPRSDPHSGGQQRDPLAPPAGRRRRFLFRVGGGTIDLPPPAARWRYGVSPNRRH